jgi:hypothetical protein
VSVAAAIILIVAARIASEAVLMHSALRKQTR